MSSSRFTLFSVTDHAYKKVEGYPVELSLIVPKSLLQNGSSSPRPVILRWHGGFLFTGNRLGSPSCPQWSLDLALEREAILISADYRLLPEATGKDVLDDIHDVVRWIGDVLPTVLKDRSLSVDTKKVLVIGESAGGWCAAQTFLTGQNIHPNVRFPAAIPQYGVLDVRDRFFNEKFDKKIMSFPQFDDACLDDRVSEAKSGKVPKVVTNSISNERTPMAISVVQSGRYVEFLGSDSILNPIENVQSYKGNWPRVLLLHSTEDSAVPIRQSETFAREVAKYAGEDKVKLITQPGEHCFDLETKLNDPWLQPNVEWVTKDW